jgi:hypothetical protein
MEWELLQVMFNAQICEPGLVWPSRCNKDDLARFPIHLLKDLGKKPEGRECVNKHSFPRD